MFSFLSELSGDGELLATLLSGGPSSILSTHPAQTLLGANDTAVLKETPNHRGRGRNCLDHTPGICSFNRRHSRVIFAAIRALGTTGPSLTTFQEPTP